MTKSWRYSTDVKFQGIFIIRVGSFEQNKRMLPLFRRLKGECMNLASNSCSY